MLSLCRVSDALCLTATIMISVDIQMMLLLISVWLELLLLELFLIRHVRLVVVVAWK